MSLKWFTCAFDRIRESTTSTGNVPTVLFFLILVGVTGCTIPTVGSGTPEFEEVAGQQGLTYYGLESGSVTGGAGVYVADVNNDGMQDVLLTGGTPAREKHQQPALFVNTGNEFERSAALPVEDLDGFRVVSAHFFDYDNDGWDDLVLFSKGRDPMFLENDRGQFKIRNVDLHLPTPVGVPMGASSADYDRDGDLDLFVYQTGNWQNTTPKAFQYPSQEIVDDNGNRNYLFENTDNGFERVKPSDSGIVGRHWSLAASFVDLTGDGWPDIHVANDFYEDTIYVNQQNGSFDRIGAGPATDRNAMSSEISDVNGDGLPDIFVTNIFLPRSQLNYYGSRYLEKIQGDGLGNNLLINRGNGSFVDRAETYGVKEGGWGWAAVITDLDDDGNQDLIHATQKYDSRFRQKIFVGNRTPAYLRYPSVWFGTGSGFERGNASELGFESSDSRGMVVLDHDQDGDQDLIIAHQSNGTYKLYRNTLAEGNWLNVALRGNASWNAIGAQVSVMVDGKRRVEIANDGADYLSQDSRVLHFGLGDAETVDRLRVTFPDGTQHSYSDINSNQYIVISINGTIVKSAAS